MGFFVEDAPAFVPITRKSAAGRAAAAAGGGVGCDNCPLQVMWQRIASARMELAGNTDNGDILVLGAAPDHEDDRAGAAFGGPSSKLLKNQIPARHLDRLVYGHLVRCCPGEGKHAEAAEIHACGTYLAEDVSKLPIRAIIGFGQEVLSRFFPGAAISRAHGLKMPVRLGNKTVWFYPVMDLAHLDRMAGGRQSKWNKGPESSAAWPVMRADIKRFFANVDRWEDPYVDDEDLKPSNVLLPESEAEARAILAEMHGQPAIDLETTSLRPYNRGARLLIGSISDESLSMSFLVDHPEGRTDWGLPLLLEVAQTRRWTAHNAAFEYSWLAFHAQQAGIDFDPQPFDDTMAMARVRYEREAMLGLESVTTLELGVNVKDVLDVKPTRILEYPLWEQLQYCGLDTMSTAKVARRLLPKLEGREAERNYERLLAATRATADMALLGLDTDQEEAQRLKLEWTAKAQEAAERAATLYEVKAFERARGTRFLISNPEHVGEALVKYGRLDLPQTAKGKQYSTDDVHLKAATNGEPNPVVDAVLEYREATKIISTYIDVILETPERCFDGRLHPGYTTMLTATLRLSSEDPNIQNFPKRRHGQIRRQVVPPKGHLFVKFDYKALEARVIAMASQDRNLCESTIKKEDIHAKWRDNALAVYPEYIQRLAEKTNETEHKKILKGGRDIIKTDFVFASFFGSTPDSCAKRTGMPLQYMQELSQEFWREFSGVRDWIKKVRREYQDTGAIRMLTGVTRRATLMGNEPINTPIQGSAAAIVIEAMSALAALSRKEREPYLHPRINIHDDLTFILPDDSSMEQYIDVIVKELVKIRFDWQIVPLAVEGAIGANWADMEEFCNYEGDWIR